MNRTAALADPRGRLICGTAVDFPLLTHLGYTVWRRQSLATDASRPTHPNGERAFAIFSLTLGRKDGAIGVGALLDRRHSPFPRGPVFVRSAANLVTGQRQQAVDSGIHAVHYRWEGSSLPMHQANDYAAEHHEQEGCVWRDPLQEARRGAAPSTRNRTIRARVEDALKFWFGGDDKDQAGVAASEVVVPANLPHWVVALRDAAKVEIFDRRDRARWIGRLSDQLIDSISGCGWSRI